MKRILRVEKEEGKSLEGKLSYENGEKKVNK